MNLRMVTNNIADSATITATTTSGSLVASNMKTEKKSEVHRSTGASVTYVLTWPAIQTVNCVALPTINLHGHASVTVNLKNAGGTVVSSATKSPVNNDKLPTDVNEFSQGNFASLVLYPPLNTSVRRVDIVIDATNIPVGYIDCAKIVVGKFWEPTFNFENGIDLNITDSSNISTTNAGEVVYDRGYIRSKLEFKYALLNDSDKNKLVEIFKECGIYKNILVSLFPTTAAEQTANEALYTIYGKRSNSSIIHRLYGFYNHSMEITSW